MATVLDAASFTSFCIHNESANASKPLRQYLGLCTDAPLTLLASLACLVNKRVNRQAISVET